MPQQGQVWGGALNRPISNLHLLGAVAEVGRHAAKGRLLIGLSSKSKSQAVYEKLNDDLDKTVEVIAAEFFYSAPRLGMTRDKLLQVLPCHSSEATTSSGCDGRRRCEVHPRGGSELCSVSVIALSIPMYSQHSPKL